MLPALLTTLPTGPGAALAGAIAAVAYVLIQRDLDLHVASWARSANHLCKLQRDLAISQTASTYGSA